MKKNFIFICLGDSLTAGNPGFSGYGAWSGNLESQFGYWLELEMNKAFPEYSFEFLNYGVGGDIVSQMSLRYTRDVTTQLDSHDYVLVMGGNNDVLWRGLSPENTITELEKLFLTIESHRAKVIALEILPVTIELPLVMKLKETNNQLHALGKKMNIPVINLYDALTDESTNGLATRYHCGDGEHLNVEGYRRVAEIIFQTFLQEYFVHELKSEK